MGYAVYEMRERHGGYGVPTICEHPDCNKEIDRGMSYACGGEPFSEYGCDRYFCENHGENYIYVNGMGDRVSADDSDAESYPVCDRCRDEKPPYPYKPESQEWVKHILNDDSWRKWREKNPNRVKEYEYLVT